MKKHGSGSFGPVSQGSVMKKEPNLFLKEKPLEDVNIWVLDFLNGLLL